MLSGKSSLQFCKLSLMRDSGQSSEDQNVNRNVDSKDPFQEISAGNKNAIGSWTPDHIYYFPVEKNFYILLTS